MQIHMFTQHEDVLEAYVSVRCFEPHVSFKRMKGPGSNDKHKIASGHFMAMRDAFFKCF